MSGDQFASLIYLSILGTVVGGYFLLANSHRMGKVAQQAAIWAMIFIGVAAAAGLWTDIRDSAANRQAAFDDGARVVVTRAQDGHYHLTLDVNGVAIPFLVDTGASDMVLSSADAARAGIDTGTLRFLGTAVTANGTVRTATIRLDAVTLGGFTDRDVTAQVSDGDMFGSLLGMAYLSRFARISIEGDRMTLAR